MSPELQLHDWHNTPSGFGFAQRLSYEYEFHQLYTLTQSHLGLVSASQDIPRLSRKLSFVDGCGTVTSPAPTAGLIPNSSPILGYASSSPSSHGSADALSRQEPSLSKLTAAGNWIYGDRTNSPEIGAPPPASSDPHLPRGTRHSKKARFCSGSKIRPPVFCHLPLLTPCQTRHIKPRRKLPVLPSNRPRWASQADRL